MEMTSGLVREGLQLSMSRRTTKEIRGAADSRTMPMGTFLKIYGACNGGNMTALKWLIAVLLAWGLFTGIAYALVPLLTDGWGNQWSFLVGVLLIVLCCAGLLQFNPRRG